MAEKENAKMRVETKGRKSKKRDTHEIQKVGRIEYEKCGCDGACNGEYESVCTPWRVFHFGTGDESEGCGIRSVAVVIAVWYYCGWAEFCGGGGEPNWLLQGGEHVN